MRHTREPDPTRDASEGARWVTVALVVLLVLVVLFLFDDLWLPRVFDH